MKFPLQILAAVLFLFSEKAALGAAPEVFALIVTNNRSYTSTRPDLQYADDDGARYYSFFKTATDEEDIALLSRFDAPTLRLYPDLSDKTRPPNKSEFEKAVLRMKALVDKAKTAHRQTAFYFVFAGHGYVEGVKGYLELEDGRIGPDDLEKNLLDQVQADVVHIILDSCDSFFVINPRKPGGRRWASPKDLTEGFSKRRPNVGVVLSTNSAAEVYEWSEVSSGIFSHEIRSGLSGAADANGDGRVSYDEMESFVATANLGIKNESYLPKVFVRGPWNMGSASLLDLRSATGRRLKLGKAERRLWIRDEQGTRLIDISKEKGTDINLVLPGNEDSSLYVEEQTANERGRYVLNEYVTPKPSKQENASAFLNLDELPKERPDAYSRGHDEVFQMVFAHPFGINAFNEYMQSRSVEQDSVFGISQSDKLRMKHYLRALAQSDRQRRLIIGGLSTALGVAFGVVGGIGFADQERRSDQLIIGSVSAVSGALFLGVGFYQLIGRSRGETAYETFIKEGGTLTGRQAEVMVAKTEEHLEKMAKREKKKRIIGASLLYLLGVNAVGWGIFLCAHDDVDWDDTGEKLIYTSLMWTSGLTAVGLGIALHFVDTPVEKMLRLYREDPDLHLSISWVPMRGGGAAGFSVAF